MKRMGRFFEGYRGIESPGLPSSEHHRRVRELSLREGPNGGSLEVYKLLERELKNQSQRISIVLCDIRRSPWSDITSTGFDPVRDAMEFNHSLL
jgi:hypothetical protein